MNNQSGPTKPFSLIRKLLVLAVGLPVLVLGLILIPLPGPGILLSLLGLIILSLEFEWAKRPADRMKGIIKDIWNTAQQKAKSKQER
jgi:uncharacterized protein (TIGR02611 family)